MQQQKVLDGRIKFNWIKHKTKKSFLPTAYVAEKWNRLLRTLRVVRYERLVNCVIKYTVHTFRNMPKSQFHALEVIRVIRRSDVPLGDVPWRSFVYINTYLRWVTWGREQGSSLCRVNRYNHMVLFNVSCGFILPYWKTDGAIVGKLFLFVSIIWNTNCTM